MPMRLPVNPRFPLAVHALTTLTDREDFERLWQANALIVPPDERRHRTRGHMRRGGAVVRVSAGWPHAPDGGVMFDLDRAAGDGRYIFMHLSSLGFRNRLAVAFSLEKLCGFAKRRRERIGFRPYDLEGAYGVVSEDVDCDGGSWEPGEGETDEDYNPFWCISTELEEVADYGTVTDPDDVLTLAELQLLARRQRNPDPPLEAEAYRIWSKQVPESEGGDDDFDSRGDLLAQAAAGIRERWENAFAAGAHNESEIVYGGPLRIREADFILRDHSVGWEYIG